MARASSAHIRRNAARHDEGRVGILVLTVAAALASLGAILAELGSGQGPRSAQQLALAAATIVLSWGFIHTIFALHYAHDYYGEHGAGRGGLVFPGEQAPDYWDFVYFSFLIALTPPVPPPAAPPPP